MLNSDNIKNEPSSSSRRAFLISAGAIGAGLYLGMNFLSKKTDAAEAGSAEKQQKSQGAPAQPQEIDIVEFSDSGERKATMHVPKVVKSDAEWKQQLSPNA